ncbi:hypothetical protein BDR22DRAFT_975063, partial [Usnea florida]
MQRARRGHTRASRSTDHDRSTTQELCPTRSLIFVTEFFCMHQIRSLLPFLFLSSACCGATIPNQSSDAVSYIAVSGRFKDGCLNSSKHGD